MSNLACKIKHFLPNHQQKSGNSSFPLTCCHVFHFCDASVKASMITVGWLF